MLPRQDLIKKQQRKHFVQEKEHEERIRHWIPHEQQEHFIRSNFTVRALIGSNRCGKTEMGVIEDISFALGYRPYLRQSDPNYRTPFKPPVKIRIFGEDYVKHVGEVIVPKLMDWVPTSEFNFKVGNPKKNPQGIPTVWRFKNGSVIELLSYEQDVEKAEGWDGHVAHFDEPPSRKLFTATWRGLTDHGGWAWMTLTPLKEPWIYDEIVMKIDEEFGKYSQVFEVHIQDNLKKPRMWYGQEVIAGGLEQENIDRFVAGVPMEERESRIFGKFSHLQGLVFPEFKPDVHIIPPFEIPNDWTRYEHIDTHPKKPWAIPYMAVAPDGTIYIYDELSIHGQYDEIIEAILTKRRDKTGKMLMPYTTLIDPIATTQDQVYDTSIAEELYTRSDKLIKPISAPKTKAEGIQQIKDVLKPNQVTGKSGFFVFNTCKKTIYEFGHLIWDDRGDKPIKENDDFIEGIYRLMRIQPTYRTLKRTEPTKGKYKTVGQGTGSIKY